MDGSWGDVKVTLCRSNEGCQVIATKIQAGLIGHLCKRGVQIGQSQFHNDNYNCNFTMTIAIAITQLHSYDGKLKLGNNFSEEKKQFPSFLFISRDPVPL